MFVKTRQINFFSISFFSRASYLVTEGKVAYSNFIYVRWWLSCFPSKRLEQTNKIYFPNLFERIYITFLL